jgi:hypothetical protein
MPRTNTKSEAATPPDEGQSERRRPGRKKKVKNKTEAVRIALQKLGSDAMPLQIQAYLKDEFGLPISADMASTYKGNLLKKAAGQSQVVRRPRAEPRTRANGTQDGFSIEDVQSVKALAERIGPDQVRQLLDVLAK